MGTHSRTIDNLGIEASINYAERQKNLDTRPSEEARYVSKQTEVAVTSPYILSEAEERQFTIGTITLWATFIPPSTYASSSTLLFSFQLIPSLGSSEKQQANLDKFVALGESLPQNSIEQKEHKTIRSLLETLKTYGRTLELINSRRSQYTKG